MRLIALAACLPLLAPLSVSAQTAPAANTASTATYTVDGSDLGTLLDNPETKAVLQKQIPQIVASDQITMARSMTLRALQQYAGDTLTDEKLKAIDADLANVKAPK